MQRWGQEQQELPPAVEMRSRRCPVASATPRALPPAQLCCLFFLANWIEIRRIAQHAALAIAGAPAGARGAHQKRVGLSCDRWRQVAAGAEAPPTIFSPPQPRLPLPPLLQQPSLPLLVTHMWQVGSWTLQMRQVLKSLR